MGYGYPHLTFHFGSPSLPGVIPGLGAQGAKLDKNVVLFGALIVKNDEKRTWLHWPSDFSNVGKGIYPTDSGAKIRGM